MKKTICIWGLTLLSSMAMASPSDSASAVSVNEEPNINIITRHEIMGLWGMEIPKNPKCIEYYNFSTASDVIVNSDKEWSIGQYQYQAPNNRSEQLPALVMQIKYDNNQKDCSGVVIDQTGEVQQFFVKWVNNQQIQFCANNNGENCFATLNRFLP